MGVGCLVSRPIRVAGNDRGVGIVTIQRAPRGNVLRAGLKKAHDLGLVIGATVRPASSSDVDLTEHKLNV